MLCRAHVQIRRAGAARRALAFAATFASSVAGCTSAPAPEGPPSGEPSPSGSTSRAEGVSSTAWLCATPTSNLASDRQMAADYCEQLVSRTTSNIPHCAIEHLGEEHREPCAAAEIGRTEVGAMAARCRDLRDGPACAGLAYLVEGCEHGRRRLMGESHELGDKRRKDWCELLREADPGRAAAVARSVESGARESVVDPAAPPVDDADPAKRVEKLKEMLDKKLIDETTYEKKKQEILEAL